MPRAEIQTRGSTYAQLLQDAVDAFNRFFEAREWQMDDPQCVAETVDVTSAGRPRRLETHWEGTFVAYEVTDA